VKRDFMNFLAERAHESLEEEKFHKSLAEREFLSLLVERYIMNILCRGLEKIMNLLERDS
jgi:hypothetical protein